MGDSVEVVNQSKVDDRVTDGYSITVAWLRQKERERERLSFLERCGFLRNIHFICFNLNNANIVIVVFL